MADIPSDIVELIIAVDLTPSDPEQPINVKDVKVGREGEGGEGGSCPMCKRLLKAIAKIEPELAPVDDEGMSIEEAIKMVEKQAGQEPEDAQDDAEKPDMFARAREMKPPKPEGGRPDFGRKPEGKSPFGDKPKFGGGRFGKDEDDEDEEDGHGFPRRR